MALWTFTSYAIYVRATSLPEKAVGVKNTYRIKHPTAVIENINKMPSTMPMTIIHGK